MVNPDDDLDTIMNVVLPARWKKFVATRIASGRFTNESDVMNAALRLLEQHDAKLDALKSEIAAGRRSGKPRTYDPEAIKRRGRAALAKRAKA